MEKKKEVNLDFLVEQYRYKVTELSHENLMLKAYIKQLETKNAELEQAGQQEPKQ